MRSYAPLTVLTCCIALFGASLLAQPRSGFNATDIFAELRLPPIDPISLKQAEGLQVAVRALKLQLTRNAAVDAWRNAELLYSDARAAGEHGLLPGASFNGASFNGTKSSELNQLFAKETNVRVMSPELQFDEPLKIKRPRASIDFGTCTLRALHTLAYMVRVEDAGDVTLTGGRFAAGDSGILISRSQRVLVRDARFDNLQGAGIVVTHSRRAVIWRNHFEGLQSAPVILHQGTSESTVASNTVTNNLGGSNWQAGVLVTDRNQDVTGTPRALLQKDGYWAVESPIRDRLDPPRDNVIAFNRIAANASSGVYIDGAIRTVIYSNEITGNAKEGLCLDNGATANVVASNMFQHNGQRWGKSDEDLKKEFVFEAGRLPDETAAAKVPAVSIDNALYNIVFDNQIFHNFGGGIKIVRTGIANAIGMNTLLDNNDGKSAKWHFFGIELGAATADAASPELDFGPSRGNVIFSNVIRGDHYAGIFFADGSERNDVFDNVILGAGPWSLESVKPQENHTLNNLTNLPSRNVSPGMDKALFGPPAAVPPAKPSGLSSSSTRAH